MNHKRVEEKTVDWERKKRYLRKKECLETKKVGSIR